MKLHNCSDGYVFGFNLDYNGYIRINHYIGYLEAAGRTLADQHSGHAFDAHGGRSARWQEESMWTTIAHRGATEIGNALRLLEGLKADPPVASYCPRATSLPSPRSGRNGLATSANDS
jgi:hypothetical protein